jgi:hypothetical protein
MTLMNFLQTPEELLGKNAFYISIIVMLLLYIIFGIKFIKDSRGFDKGSAARGYYVGLGLFIISVAFGEGFYLMDLIFRTHFGGRIFLKLDPGALSSIDDWQHFAGVRIDVLFINRDYYIAIFVILLVSLSFLMKPLEVFMLRRERPIVTYIDRILIPIPLLIRMFEVNFYSWFGVQVLEDSIQYYILTGLWIFVIAMLVISIALLIGLYLKMGKESPKGSSLRRKSFLIIIGIGFWIGAVFLTKSVHDMLKTDWYAFPAIPLLLVLSLGCMISGFKREF